MKKAINNIVKNRNFLIAETKGFIEAEFPTVKDTYDDDGKCSRDLGFLLDAITYDLTYGGNLETSVAAQSYFSDVVAAAVPSEKTSNEVFRSATQFEMDSNEAGDFTAIAEKSNVKNNVYIFICLILYKNTIVYLLNE